MKNNNSGYITGVEVLIIITLIGFLAAVAIPIVKNAIRENSINNPRQTSNIKTCLHDNHLFITYNQDGIIHHPDCPCLTNRASEIDL